MTNCTHKKPEFENELVVFESPYNDTVLLVDKATYDKYGHLCWYAVQHDTNEYTNAIAEHNRKFLGS